MIFKKLDTKGKKPSIPREMSVSFFDLWDKCLQTRGESCVIEFNSDYS